MKNKIAKDGEIVFNYNIYDKKGNWIQGDGPINMIVGKDTFLKGLSNSLIGLDYTIQKHLIDFQMNFNNSNNTQDSELVNLEIMILNYNDFYHNNNNENINLKKSHNHKKEEKDFKNEILKLQKEIMELQKNEISLNKKVLEVSANAKKQIEEFKELNKKHYEDKMQDLKDFQFQSFFERILGPLNNLYMAVEFGSNNSENTELVGYVKGFELLVNQIFTILNSYGISVINPSVGDEFNPELHNILELVKTKEYKKDKITELRNRGYKLNGRVIMPANVFVSSGKK